MDHKLDINVQTSDLLTEVEFADDLLIKRLVNYNLATNRHDYENMLEAKEEYFEMQKSPEMAKMWY